MERVFKKEGRFYCDADTEEAILMQEIAEANEQQKEATELKKQKRLVLEALTFENGEPEPVYLESPDFEAHWCTMPRNLNIGEWEMLKECFPDAYMALNGDNRTTTPFLAVTRKEG